jgi:methyl halide transferase
MDQTDWDHLYKERHTPWEKGAPAPPLVAWLSRPGCPIAGRVLVPGCGSGHDVRAITQSCPLAQVLGLDISPAALQFASSFPKANAESYRLADLFDLPPDLVRSFDWVFEHTCFCAITPSLRDAYVDAVASALKPGGELLGIFFLDPYDDEHLPGEGPPHGCSFLELHQRFVQSGRFEMISHHRPSHSYEGREGAEIVLHLRLISP